MRAEFIQKIRAFIEAKASDPQAFEQLALAIHRYQHARDPVVRALRPEPAHTLDAIPAVPVGLFRDLDVGTIRPDEAHTAFHTSGTTVGKPGIHRIRDASLYDFGCHRHAARWLPDTVVTYGLLPDSPHSSLAHMVRGFAPLTGPVQFLQTEAGLDTGPLSDTRPIFVCATAFALDIWLTRSPRPLPPGSAILVTGGFKGRAHALEPDALVAAATRLAPVVLEYGMTELSSQLWARPGQPYQPPHWLRVQAVDPITGIPQAPDQMGQLRFIDLCNLDGTVHIETLDRGIVHRDGSVTLKGRLEDAPARGCSLTAEGLR